MHMISVYKKEKKAWYFTIIWIVQEEAQYSMNNITIIDTNFNIYPFNFQKIMNVVGSWKDGTKIEQ